MLGVPKLPATCADMGTGVYMLGERPSGKMTPVCGQYGVLTLAFAESDRPPT